MASQAPNALSPYNGLASLEPDSAFDLIIIGAGAGGMAAALFAALQGAKPLLVERTPYVGGTSALSGGTVWAPLTRYLNDTATNDNVEKVMKFLDNAVGECSDRTQREAFIRGAAEAIHTLVDRTEVDFRACARHPDYMDLPGTTLCGRALEPLPYVATRLGKARSLLRPPIPEFTVLGGMMINREDIGHLLNRFKTPTSFLYSMKLVGNYALDRLRFGQTRRSVMGHALIARMLQSVLDLNIPILVNTEVSEITRDESGEVNGVTLKQGEASRALQASKGVILASGGFARNPDKRKALLPATLPEHSPAAEGHSSNLHTLAEQVGAHYGQGHDQASFWAPVSVRQRIDGSTAVFPHFVFDRSKPGTLCVDLQGRRFVNETISYHEFGKTMLEGGEETQAAWLVADAKAVEKYGLGMVRPAGDDLEPFLADGYLHKGDTVTELAKSIGVPTLNLQHSINSINSAAKSGDDDLFGRGSTDYQRHNGDPTHRPNPTIGALEQPPYYAVRLQPADIGTALGLAGDVNGQLTDSAGTPIKGLYACGNDLHSIMGGRYPGPGITIGPAIVFANLAVKHALAH